MRLLRFALPILFLLVGAPLALGRVGPNRWYGYRTAFTLGDPAVWYKVNRELGIAMLLAGTLGILVGLMLVRLTPGWRGESRILVSVLVQAMIFFMAALVVVVRTQRL
jgi:uncharacterized membrane protein